MLMLIMYRFTLALQINLTSIWHC